MPEIKNTFLKGKMNKDLDARLIPNGEYIDAQNIHITKSEGSDVGVVQNIKGNSAIGNITFPGIVIGYIAESESLADGSNRIFYFFKGDANAQDAIYYYNTSASMPDPPGNPQPIVKGSFLNFSASKLITGVNIIDGLLFWTDDNNQPRKINIQKAIDSPNYYDNEDKISVAKYYPYNPPQVLHPTVDTQTGIQKLTTTASVNGALVAQTAVALSGTINYDIFVGQVVTGAGVANDTLVVTYNHPSLVLNKPITVANAAVLSFKSNENRLEEEFVKFAYRYKFSDGEYSVISPFTQTCFLPKSYNGSPGLTDSQIKEAFKTTEISSMINDAGQVNLRIKLPSANVTTDYGITKIEILYKEADNPGIKAVAQETLTDANAQDYTYTYKLTLPFKTLTEDQTIRVFDNVPRQAKSQEIAGNRLIYGNFLENYSMPSIDFEAGYVNRASTALDQNWNNQYPHQSVKSRRTYQIGLVLADKYGRQSPVILPSDVNKSSVKVPVHTASPSGWNGYALRVEFNDVIPEAYDPLTRKFGWYSWRVVVKQTEQSYYNIYAPGVQDSFPHGATTGTLNTTATQILDGVGGNYSADDERSWLVLHGDNINKVPREAGNGGIVEANGISGSEISLYPVISNASLDHTGTGGDDFVFNSDGNLVDVISIGSAKEQGLVFPAYKTNDDGTSVATKDPGEVFGFVYESTKNHLVAELPDGYGFKRLDDGADTLNLGIWETKPIKSGLDIYYETSLVGLVADLNNEIDSVGSGTGGPHNIVIDNSSFSESATTNTVIGALSAENSSGSTISNVTFVLNSVFALSNLSENLVNKFNIENGTNNLRTSSPSFYYGSSGETYSVSITATDQYGVDKIDNLLITLSNAAPTFSNSLSSAGNVAHYSASVLLNAASNTFNGSADTTRNTEGLVYSIVSVHYDPDGNNTDVTSSNLFSITNTGDTGNPAAGELKNTNYFAANQVGKIYRILLKVRDAGHTSAAPSEDTHTFNVTLVPGTLLNKPTAPNAPQLCNPTTQTLYITKPSSNTGGTTIEVGDSIYTDIALGTNYFYGNIITQPIGGLYDQGLYAQVQTSNGVVEYINLNVSCAP